MPDISMCQNKKCKKYKTCYRFTAKPDHYQSYGSFSPDEKGVCKYYYRIDKKDKIND